MKHDYWSCSKFADWLRGTPKLRMGTAKEWIPWYCKILRLGIWRCPEAGLAHLEWAAGLKTDEDWCDKDDPTFGKPTPQALAAQQTIVLYKWWKEERPNRPDPMDASGWSNYCEERRRAAETQGDDDLSWIGCDPDEPDRERASKISETCHKMEREQEDEDTEMLIRLIKIRGSLWT